MSSFKQPEAVKFYLHGIPVYRRFKQTTWEYRLYEDTPDTTVFHINGSEMNINKHADLIINALKDQLKTIGNEDHGLIISRGNAV